MLMLECLEVIERIFSMRNRLALLTYLDLLEAFKLIFLPFFLALFEMKLPDDYFGMKIRKIEPVKNPVEGLKVKFPLILAHPVPTLKDARSLRYVSVCRPMYFGIKKCSRTLS